MTLLGKIGMGLLLAALVAAGILSSQGFIHVRIQEKQTNGKHLRLVVPAIAVPAVLELAPRQRIEDAARQVRPWLPAADVAETALGDCPDGPLVEVAEPSERVSVSKSGSSLVVDVNDPREQVQVSVPLAALRSATHILAERGAAN